MKTKYLLSFIYISLLIVIVVVLYKIRPDNRPSQAISPSPTITPVATPTGFMTLASPKIEKKEVYKIAMVGDSMTAALGPHGGGMSEYINDLYKESDDNQQAIIIDNYAVSSNLLSVDKQISEKLTVSEYTFGPLLATDYDLILIESFGYNPLSEFGVDEGIKKQNEALDTLMEKLIKEKPKMAIIFVATIAPNLDNYAKSTQTETTSEDRKKQAEERIAYLKNHIEYAKSHNIPLINMYEKSLTENGDGNIKYVNETDDIHPSFQGVEFIGEEIGNYIFENNILPH